MSIETKIRYLLGAASRLEGEGDSRTARILRRMAEEARAAEVSRSDEGPRPRPRLQPCGQA